MSPATLEELTESINDLIAYRDRLRKEISTVSKKLRMPQKKIDSSIANHSELNQINEILSQLKLEKDKLEKSDCY